MQPAETSDVAGHPHQPHEGRAGARAETAQGPFPGKGGAGSDARKGGDRERPERRLRIPIFIKLAALSTLLILLVVLTTNFFIVKKQKEQFLAQLMDLGESMLRIVANNVPDKLLGEEELDIFQLLKDISEHEQVLYAMVTDAEGKIKAHSNLENANRPYAPPRYLKPLRVASQFKINLILHDGEEVLYVEGPIRFQNLKLGDAYIAISQKALREGVRKAFLYILIMAIAISVFGIFLSLGVSMYFSRPIHKLVEMTRDLGTGDFSRRVEINRNDELGDLGIAFNAMAKDLELKEKIRDSFGRYVTPEIVDLVLASPDNRWMKGYRVDVTVLFVDIRGFTSLSETKEPEEVVELLNGYFSDVTDVVIKYGGHLNKFVGDEAMAVFGAPVKDPEHAESAVRAALDIQRAIAAGNQRGLRKTEIHVGIGVNSGEVVAGNLGSDKRMEYTVIGDNVNVASRLTSIAKAGEIIISERTLDEIEHKATFVVEERGKVAVKGRKKEIRILNVTDIRES
jgi:adenylate cyclase